jgi:adenylate cyclase
MGEHEADHGANEERIRRVEESILGSALYTGEELARLTGVPLEDAERLWAELGFAPVAPDQRHFTEADAEVLRNVAEFRQWGVVGFDDIAAMTRVLGQALARAAGAEARLIMTGVARPGRRHRGRAGHGRAGTPEAAEAAEPHGDDEGAPSATASLEHDDALETAVTVGAEVSERFLSYVWRRHLAAALRRALDPRPTEVVGFADLVGYTRLSARLEPAELPALLGRFQQLATTQAGAQGGRVVKLIGDAVMFLAPDPRSAALAALGLRDAMRTDPEAPKVRIGLATGPLVHLEGDVYGDTVNRASRIAELARPDTVLADDDTAAALADAEEVALRPIRPHRLKGIGLTRCWAVRPARAAGA